MLCIRCLNLRTHKPDLAVQVSSCQTHLINLLTPLSCLSRAGTKYKGTVKPAYRGLI